MSDFFSFLSFLLSATVLESAAAIKTMFKVAPCDICICCMDIKNVINGLERNFVTRVSQEMTAQMYPLNFLNWKFNYSRQRPLWPCVRHLLFSLDRYKVIISGFIAGG